jgi:hypothetical protein
MTIAEFNACLEGYRVAHGLKGKRGGGDIDEENLRLMGIEGF